MGWIVLLVIVYAIYTVWWLARRDKRIAKERDAVRFATEAELRGANARERWRPQESREVQRLAEPPIRKKRPTQAPLATWRLKYRDIEGTMTTRVVHVLKVKPIAEQIEAWCELRADKRTFWFAGIKEIVDLSTGEIIEFDEWLDGYKASRRSRPSRQGNTDA